jgi:hypothetical protein
MFVKMLHERCLFLKRVYAYDLELASQQLQTRASLVKNFYSSLFKMFLEEVNHFIDKNLRQDWANYGKG